MRRLVIIGVFAASSLVLTSSALASYIVDRNTSKVRLQVDKANRALVTYRAAGQLRHVLVYGAMNAVPPTAGQHQTAFKVDYAGGWKALHNANYFKTIKNVCKKYKGPKLPYFVAACTMPDGSSWALQSWQRLLPLLGFSPWRPDQSARELHISHWKGPLPQFRIWQDWSWGMQWHQIFGDYTYAGKPVFGFNVTPGGAPLDSWGRVVFLDTLDPVYGRGWFRENGYLAQQFNGKWCYSLGPRDPFPGYPKAPPRIGVGKAYRLTALGPGVLPIVTAQVNDIGNYDPNNPTHVKLEQDSNAMIHQLGFNPSTCHD
jgi:hypothetical protein